MVGDDLQFTTFIHTIYMNSKCVCKWEMRVFSLFSTSLMPIIFEMFDPKRLPSFYHFARGKMCARGVTWSFRLVQISCFFAFLSRSPIFFHIILHWHFTSRIFFAKRKKRIFQKWCFWFCCNCVRACILHSSNSFIFIENLFDVIINIWFTIYTLTVPIDVL